MSGIPAPQRIETSPAVRTILETDSSQSQLLRHFLRYLEALLADPAGLDNFVIPDCRCHELEPIGYPQGREGFRLFRRQVNAAIPDEHISINAVRFEGNDIIEADMVKNPWASAGARRLPTQSPSPPPRAPASAGTSSAPRRGPLRQLPCPSRARREKRYGLMRART